VYYLVSVWSPVVLVPPDDETATTVGIDKATFGKVYATVRSAAVRVEVVPGNNP
jgi:hypothetical protein